MVKYLQLVICLFLFGISSQVIGQSIDFTVRYNPSAGNYEVYALPDFSSPNYFVGGGSQISLVLPTAVPNGPLTITTVNGGQWFDNSQVYAPTADPVHDFHGVASNGSLVALVANEELLLYTFVLPGGGCVDSLRLFENPTDPNSMAPGMGGGDFLNYFANALTFADSYNANYNNTGTSCNPPVVIPNPLTIPQDSTGTICAPIVDPDAGDTFTAMSCGASHGTPTLTINGNEICVEYVPDSGYIGIDSVCIIVCDQVGACDTTNVPVTVVPPLPPSTNPEPPLVVPTPITTPEDSTTTVCTPILDPNATDTFTATLCTGSPANGTATPTVVGNSLCVEYTPDSGYTGSDEICVIVCGIEDGLCDTVMIPVTVLPEIEPPTTPQPPTVILPPVVTPEDSTITTCGPVIDPNPLDTHTVMICDQPTNGTATTTIDNTTGQVCVTFIPNENFTGIDSVCVEICDNGGLCTQVEVPVVVLPTNDPPTAIDDINNTVINEPTSGSVLTNDQDIDEDSLFVNPTPVGTPLGGTPTINPDGTYTFVPDTDFIGEAIFQYEVCDNGSPVLCDTATVVIEVFDTSDPNNNPPIGTEDNFITEEDSPITASLISNDNDPDGDSIAITTTPITPPSTGSLTINPDGTFTFTPDPAFTGQETFEYEVCDNGTPMACDTVTVTIEILPDNGVNDTYATDDAGIGNENEPLTGDLLANDTDPEGDNQIATTTPLSDPSNGTVVINPDGTYEYTPDPGFTGNDLFVYQVCDDGTPVACDSATVYITILDVNEVIAIDDINTTAINDTVTGNVLTNDIDPEGDSLIINSTPIGTPVGGTVTINPDGTYEFAPTMDFLGEASFQYEVCDDGMPVACDTATVVIEVFDNNDPDNNSVVGVEDNFITEETAPINASLISNDFDPDGDSIFINTTPVTSPTDGTLMINPDGTFTYTADPDFTGTDSFEYEVCDTGTPQTCDTVTVTIEVLPDNGVNDTYATDDTGFGTGGEVITGNVAANDTDPEGDNQIVTTTPLSGPTGGSVTLAPDGTFSYMPNPGFEGNDQFVYEICDDGTPVACDSATVYITIIEMLSPPVVLPNPLTIPQDSTGELCMPILDPNIGDTFTAMSCGANNGTETVMVVGTDVCVEYVPDSGFNGTDSICIIVCDQSGLCDTTSVPVTVVAPPPTDPTPQPPTVIPTPIYTPEDSTTTVCTPILDPNVGDTFTAAICPGSPANGTAIPTVVGTEVCIEYTPTSGFTGDDEICLIVCGVEDGLCDTVSIPVTVVPTIEPPEDPQPPVIILPPVVGPEDSTVTVCGPIFDPNPLDTHSVMICEQPANATATASVDNTTDQLCVTIDPDENFTGIDSVCVVLCDSTGLCDTLNIPIVITDINEVLAVDDINTTQIFTPTSGNVLTNDDDPEGDALLVNTIPIGTPIGGTVLLNPDGTYTFTPDSAFVGEAIFQYEVCDDGIPTACDTATVTIEVVDTRNEDNNPVNGNEDHIVTEEGIVTTVNVLSNDTDPDGDNLIIDTTPVTDPTDGTVIINPDGTVTYTPNPDFVGTDSFEYEVCDDGTPVTCDTVLVTIEVLGDDGNNDVYATDDAASGPINTDILGSVLDNDNDPEGDNLTVTTTPVSGPTNGSVSLLADGTFTYTPNTDYTGNDQFVYAVCDDGTPIACDTATVYLSILDELSPPVIIPNPITTPQDSTAEVCMPITDPNEGDTFTTTICGAEHGTPTATVNGAEVCINYIPDPGYNGTDSVCVIVCDQTGMCDTTIVPVTIVEPLPPSTDPEPPVVITTPITVLEDSTTTVCTPILDPNTGDTFNATLCTGSPANGTATPTIMGNELCVEYTPSTGYTGDDEICVIVCGNEDGLCDTIMIPVTVIPLPEYPDSMQPPIVIVPPIIGTNDTTHTICGTIVDPNTEDTHTVTICEQPANGTATAAVDNTTGQVCITLDPNDDFIGDDSLCLVVCDNTGLCDTVTVPITIVPSVVKLDLKVLLQGAMFYTTDGFMRDDLKTQGLVPLAQPYNSTLSSRFTHVGGGSETTTNVVLSQNISTPDAIVDWVFIEIRSTTDSSSVIRTISALVQRDGDVIDAATGNTLCVIGLPATFFVSVKHRNHLGAMTSTPMDPVNESLVVDFTTMADADLFHLAGYDNLEMTTVSGKRALWAGNANADEKVKYDGTNNDRIKLLNDVLLYPTNTSFTLNFDNAIEYLQGDVDMTGKAKYDGMGNDRILIQNVVLTYPLNSLLLNNYNNLLEQLP